jgi:hypothetical protein
MTRDLETASSQLTAGLALSLVVSTNLGCDSQQSYKSQDLIASYETDTKALPLYELFGQYNYQRRARTPTPDPLD